MENEIVKEKDNTILVIKIILSIIGFIYIVIVAFEGLNAETILQQQYNGLRILAGWLFLIWVALIMKGDKN